MDNTEGTDQTIHRTEAIEEFPSQHIPPPTQDAKGEKRSLTSSDDDKSTTTHQPTKAIKHKKVYKPNLVQENHTNNKHRQKVNQRTEHYTIIPILLLSLHFYFYLKYGS